MTILHFCKVMFALLIVVPAGFILQEYVVLPNQSIKEGLLDWFHESDDDF